LDPSTLTLYPVAGGLSCCLGLVLLVFARFQPNTRLLLSWALGLQAYAAAFVVSGFGPVLPRWATVIGTNTALIAAGTFMYSGARAYCRQEPARLDRVGWAITALAVPAFVYWGMVSANQIPPELVEHVSACMGCLTPPGGAADDASRGFRPPRPHGHEGH
jgi:hypothetical protein